MVKVAESFTIYIKAKKNDLFHFKDFQSNKGSTILLHVPENIEGYRYLGSLSNDESLIHLSCTENIKVNKK